MASLLCIFVQVLAQERDYVTGVEPGFVRRVCESMGFIGIGDQGDFLTGGAESLVEPLGMLWGNKGILASVVQQERFSNVFRVVYGRNAAWQTAQTLYL